MRSLGSALSLCLLMLSGCSLENSQPNPPFTGAQLRGSIHGGNQAVGGATIQLYAVGSSGYGSASKALLTSVVQTDSGGNWTITGNYVCPTADTLVYITGTGGNPGLGPDQTNPQLAEMAALGRCGDLTANTFVVISELTTVAAIWPLAPFMTDYQHIGTSSTNAIGLQNAFISAAQLANVTVANQPGVVGPNVTAPVAEMNTLANILAACVNSAGGVAGDGTVCGTLMTNATITGNPAPTDTIGAALSIAQQPGKNVAALYALSVPAAPFQPTLALLPNDWTVSLLYNNEAIAVALLNPSQLAIDASQNVWVAYGHYGIPSGTVFEYNQDLTLTSPPEGFTNPTLSSPAGIAIDLNGNVWVANLSAPTLTEYLPNGSYLTSATGGGIYRPSVLAVDKSNNIWVGNMLSPIDGVAELSNDGTALSPAIGYHGAGIYPSYTSQYAVVIDTTGNAWFSTESQTLAKLGPAGNAISGSNGYRGGGLGTTYSLAIDGTGNVWAANDTGVTPFKPGVSAFRSTGAAFSPTTGFIGGGLQNPYGIAVDGAGHIWISNHAFYASTGPQATYIGYLAELDSTGAGISPSTGYGTTPPHFPYAIAIDASGNVWTTGAFATDTKLSKGNATLSKCVGVAAPVVTPISVATKNGQLGARP